LRTLSAADEQVAELRDHAVERLELGDFGGAMGALDEAVVFDSASADALEANLVSRRLSAAESLSLKADVARTALDYDTALAALREARELYMKLEAFDLPLDGRVAHIELMRELGNLYNTIGRTEDALHAFTEMHTLAVAEVATRPEDDAAKRLLAAALERLGRIKMVIGAPLEAKALLDEGIALAAPLAERHPDDVAYLQTYSDLLAYLGDLLRKEGDLAGADKTYRAEREVIFKLMELEDGERKSNYTLRFADSYLRTGMISVDMDHYELAVVRLDYARGFYEDLVEEAPERLGLRSRLARVWGAIGRAHMKAGKPTEADAAYRAQLEQQEVLVSRSPRDAGFRHQYAVSLVNMGDARFDSDALEEAVGYYGSALEMALEAQRQDPTDAVRHRLVVGARFRVGDVHKAEGRREAAAASYRAGRDVLLAEQARNPDAFSNQTGLMIAYINLGQVEDDPVESLRAGVAIADRLEARGELSPYYSEVARDLRRLLAAAE